MDRALQELYRSHFGQLVASLTRVTGDMQLAEDSIQDAFLKATRAWPKDSVPDHARAWLMTTARNAALDQLRRAAALKQRLPQVAIMQELERPQSIDQMADNEDPSSVLADDMLRLVFTCCHPALNIDAQVALCLHTVCGLHTQQIARAFVVTDATMSQRLWRAKTKIRDARISYQLPGESELPARLDAVLAVVYLIFNEGWLASTGDEGLTLDLANEAIRLARLVMSLLKGELAGAAQAQALLGLMLLQHSRRLARFDDNGQLVLLAEQDRTLWDQHNLAEGMQLVRGVFRAGYGDSRYAILGAIACVHASAGKSSSTDWNEITKLYEHLMELDPSAIVALNHAVAVGERDGPESGLQKVMQLAESKTLQRYYLFHSARAEFCRRLGRFDEAKNAYLMALKFVGNEVERDFLSARLELVLQSTSS